MAGYQFFPVEETGYNVRAQHPAIARWLDRIQSLPGWRAPYDCLPGERIAPRGH
jgi:glutathione S-transferase